MYTWRAGPIVLGDTAFWEDGQYHVRQPAGATRANTPSTTYNPTRQSAPCPASMEAPAELQADRIAVCSYNML